MTQNSNEKIRERKRHLKSLKAETLVFLATSLPSNMVSLRLFERDSESTLSYVEKFVDGCLQVKEWLFGDFGILLLILVHGKSKS